jgi:antitoxin component YwqK of YwqJK toxin-antitoxin module
MSYEETKHSNGSFRREWMTEDGKSHREDGPAIIYYHPDGSIRTEYFYLNGRLRRESGPAIVWYNSDGSISEGKFFLNGEFIGYNEEGFWALWGNLTEEQRKNPELLKYLARFS